MGVELEPGQVERLLDLDRKFGKEGLTFDDVLLVPAESRVLPNEVSTATHLTRGITIEIPIVSAAMDTVTEARLAIALAREGGMGIIHRNLSIDAQMAEVDKVKRSESGMIVEPVTLPRNALVSDALDLMATYHISGVPITDETGTLVGILTNRDLRFAPDASQPVSALMTSRDLVTAPLGTTLAEAEAILHRHKIEKLPVVDAEGRLRGSSPSRTSRSGSSSRRRRKTSMDDCASAPLWVSAQTPGSARARWSMRVSTCWSSIRRTAIRRPCRRWCGGSSRSSRSRSSRAT
jgi:IMP dehydrogenase/GMP reductase